MGYGTVKRLSLLVSKRAPLGDKLNEAAALVNKAGGFEGCSIYVLDEKRGRFVLKGSRGRRPGGKKSLRVDEGPAAEARRRGGPIEVLVPRVAPRKGKAGGALERVLAFPLKAAGRVRGALVIRTGKGAGTAGAKGELLEALGSVVALIICYDEARKAAQAALRSLKDSSGRLRNAEKMLALGDIAAHLAHEIRNPLVSIGGFAMRARKHLESESPALPYIDSLVTEIQRIEKLVNGAVRFFREEEFVLKPDDLNGILLETLSLFEDDIEGRGIRVVKDLREGGLPVLADREQLKIAFDNIIANAIQSMENGGTLTLHTDRAGLCAVASVTDSGGGIDPRHLGYIFNPFFTTKKDGTGLGLTITSAIIARHRGSIEVVNAPGVGATFEIKLPYAGDDKKRNEGADAG